MQSIMEEKLYVPNIYQQKIGLLMVNQLFSTKSIVDLLWVYRIMFSAA